MTRDQMLDDWLAKALHIRGLPTNEPWPAWSMGEMLAVALILGDAGMLAELDYTDTEALERLRWDIEEPTVESTRAVFDRLRTQVNAGGSR